MDLLTRIRSKSSLVRTQYALVAAAVFTGLVALIWLTTLPARFAGVEEEIQTRTEERVSSEPGEDASAEPAPSISAPALEGLNLDPAVPVTGTSGDATASGSKSIQIATTSQIAE